MRKNTIIISLVLLATMLAIASPVSAQTAINIAVQPYETTPSAVGQEFTIDINLTGVTGVQTISAWGISLRFDPGILIFTNAASGGFLAPGGAVQPMTIGNHTAVGWLSLGELINGEGSVTANGTLAKVTFKVLGGGRCVLQLYDTNLLDADLQPIQHTDSNGAFVYNFVTLAPQSGTAAFVIQGFGFGQSANIKSVLWNDTEMVLPLITCDGRGNFVVLAASPTTGPAGNYNVYVLDSAGNHKNATFTLVSITGPQGPEGPTGPQGITGPTGEQGPAGTASMEYTWLALILSIVAIIIAVYGFMRKK